jgi:AraC-like DNA-binding protein
MEAGFEQDWAIRARHYEHLLTEGAPARMDVHVFPEPTLLELDVHAGSEVGIILQGGEERHYQDSVWRAEPGDIWLCATWEPHGWRVTRPDTHNVVLTFLPSFLGDATLGGVSWLSLFTLPPRDRPHLATPEVKAKMRLVAVEIREEIERRQAGWQEAVRLNLLRALLLLHRCREESVPGGAPAGVGAGKLARIMPALDLLQADPTRRLTVPEAAACCGMSESRFAAAFQEVMGTTFQRFGMRSRLGSAARLLLNTDLSIESVAERSGFANGSHLHHAFLKQYGSTPGAYRDHRRRT